MRGKNYTFPSSEQMQVLLHLNKLCVNFTQGLEFTLRVFVVNSVGTSDPVSAEAIVPCELLTNTTCKASISEYMNCPSAHEKF